MHVLGLDLGTTTICGVVLDEDFNECKAITRANESEIQSDLAFERIQDPNKILAIVQNIADELIKEYPDIQSIGISGQMHGILYYDNNGKAISPLYYWQDKRADELMKDGKSYLQHLIELTSARLAAGYGAASHYYNTLNHLVPANACGLCTIGDYVAMSLANGQRPLVHSSQAASIGLYDLKHLCFDETMIQNAGMDVALFPKTCTENKIIGQYRDIDVYVSLGDNQASFYGSKTPKDGILINVGTGSQISLVSDYVETKPGVELRPLNKTSYLLVGAAICGGKSYAILKKFFMDCAEMFGCEVKDMYSLMNNCVDTNDEPLNVDTRFLGSRTDPSVRGKIANINATNLTPANLIKGFNVGMAQELYDLYLKMGKPAKKRLIGSGNGCRYNQNFVKEAQQLFGMELTVSELQEEAACGAAIFTKEK